MSNYYAATSSLVTKYFKLLYNMKKSNGKLNLQLEQRDHKKSGSKRGTAKNKYDEKKRYRTNKHRTSRSCNYPDDRNCDHGYKLSHDSGNKCEKHKRKAPPEFSGKPCHVHGNKAKHTYEE